MIRFGFGSFRRFTGKRVRMPVCVDISVSALGINMVVIDITLYSCLEAHACVSFRVRQFSSFYGKRARTPVWLDISI